LDEASESIRNAAQEAEMKSDFSTDWVTVGISGDHIQSFNCHGAVTVQGKRQEVSAENVSQVIQAAQSIPIPPEREIIHVLPQEFRLDGRGDIHNPVGLSGTRLDVDIHVVTCESALTQNIINAVNRAQMRVKRVVLQQLASAEAVLTPDEKDLGVALLDIGGGTTDIALFSRNSIRSTSVMPVGGAHFTRDLAIGLRTPIEEAEQIKIRSGSIALGNMAEDEMIEIPGVGTRDSRLVQRRVIGGILHDRAAELMELVKNHIERTGDRDQLVSGAVLTGGGSMMDGIIDLAEQVLEMPVRRGLPNGIQGLTDELSHPIFATAVGLAKIGLNGGLDYRVRGGKTGTVPWFVNRFLTWVGS
jgi:cell division protein FtsA